MKIRLTYRFAAVLLVAMLAGCTPTLQQVTQSREVYTATLHELNDLRHAGKISPALHDQIEPARAAAAKALDDMEATARNRDTISAAMAVPGISDERRQQLQSQLDGAKVSYQSALDAASAAVQSFVQIEQQAKGGN